MTAAPELDLQVQGGAWKTVPGWAQEGGARVLLPGLGVLWVAGSRNSGAVGAVSGVVPGLPCGVPPYAEFCLVGDPRPLAHPAFPARRACAQPVCLCWDETRRATSGVGVQWRCLVRPHWQEEQAAGEAATRCRWPHLALGLWNAGARNNWSFYKHPGDQSCCFLSHPQRSQGQGLGTGEGWRRRRADFHQKHIHSHPTRKILETTRFWERMTFPFIICKMIKEVPTFCYESFT